MKFAAIAFAVLAAAIVILGTPVPVAKPLIDRHWDSPVAVLPMTFDHFDHTGQNCVLCHHNYLDDTGGDPCMYCHVTNMEVSQLLEEQFHGLCMSCHVEKQLAGEVHGPVRQCVKCHLMEDRP